MTTPQSLTEQETRVPPFAGLPFEYFQELLGKIHRQPDGIIVGDWLGCRLSSVFQPLVDPTDGSVLGHEAFIRCAGSGGHELSPWGLFSTEASDQQVVALDRLCRIIHTQNFIRSGDTGGALFLNVHGRLLASVEDRHGYVFRSILDALDFPADRIVIEPPLLASRQPELLAFVLRNFRENGFQVAINVASVAQAQRIASLVTPDFVKVTADHLGFDDPLSGTQVQWLEAIAGHSTLVISRLERQLARLPDVPLWVQGNAYRIPLPAPVDELRHRTG